MNVPVYRSAKSLVSRKGRKYQLPDTKHDYLRMTVGIGPKMKPRVKFTDVSNRRIRRSWMLTLTLWARLAQAKSDKE